MTPDGLSDMVTTVGPVVEWNLPSHLGPAPSVMSLETLMKAIPDAVFIHDHYGRFLEVNDLACAGLGYTRSELMKLNVLDIEQDFDMTSAQSAMSRMKPGTRVVVDGHHRRKDGSVFPVRLHFGVMDYFGTRLYIAVARDMSPPPAQSA